MSDRERSPSDSRSRSRDRGGAKKSYSRSRSRSRTPSKKRYSRSRSRSYQKYSRSRSRSYDRKRRYSRSRSRSYDRRRSNRGDRDRDYNDDRRYDDRRGYTRSRSRSPFSRRRRHLGDRENPATSRCVGVFGLNLHTKERDLRDMFEKYGPIEDLQIVYDHQTGKSRGFGFIYYRDLEDAMDAKEHGPGQELDGHKLRVDYSITKRAHTPTPGVYLGRPVDTGYRARRSRSPYKSRRRTRSRSYSRDRSYSPRRY